MQSETKKKERSYGAGISKTRLDYDDPMFILEVEGMARDGYDDSQIAEYYNVAPETFNRNKLKKGNITPENPKGLSQISLALTRGRRPLEVLIENSLYKRGIGMTITTKTKTVITQRLILPDGTETNTMVVKETETETETQIPPDFNCMQLWLRAKKPDMYNIQPTRLDITSAGKAIEGPPRVTEIKHVQIAATEVTKTEVDV